MEPAGRTCYRCQRPIREADLLRGMAVQVGSLYSCDACAEPLLARLTPEQRRAIFRKLDGPPPPEDDGVTVEDLSAEAPPQERPPTVRTRARTTSFRPPTVSGRVGPPPRKQGVPPLVWVVGAGAIVLLLAIALVAGRNRKTGTGDPAEGGPASRRREAPSHASAPASRTASASTPERASGPRPGEIAALERDIREKSIAQEYQKALDALEAARSRDSAAAWIQAVDRLEREIRDAAGGAFVRLQAKLQEALERSDADALKALQADVSRWGIPQYQEEVKRRIGDLATRLKTGLACWLKLDETSGTTAADASGKGHPGTLQGNPRWEPASGTGGGALAFDGTGDVVTSDLPGPHRTDITWCAWIRTRRGGAILGHSHEDWQAGGKAVLLTSQGKLVLDDHTVGRFEADTRLADGAWHHVALVVVPGGSDAQVRMLADGKGVFARRMNFYQHDGSSMKLRIGRLPAAGSPFQGALRDVRIYDRALSDAEIQRLVQETVDAGR